MQCAVPDHIHRPVSVVLSLPPKVDVAAPRLPVDVPGDEGPRPGGPDQAGDPQRAGPVREVQQLPRPLLGAPGHSQLRAAGDGWGGGGSISTILPTLANTDL